MTAHFHFSALLCPFSTVTLVIYDFYLGVPNRPVHMREKVLSQGNGTKLVLPERGP